MMFSDIRVDGAIFAYLAFTNGVPSILYLFLFLAKNIGGDYPPFLLMSVGYNLAIITWGHLEVESSKSYIHYLFWVLGRVMGQWVDRCFVIMIGFHPWSDFILLNAL
jgi:hypothetical protein